MSKAWQLHIIANTMCLAADAIRPYLQTLPKQGSKGLIVLDLLYSIVCLFAQHHSKADFLFASIVVMQQNHSTFSTVKHEGETTSDFVL